MTRLCADGLDVCMYMSFLYGDVLDGHYCCSAPSLLHLAVLALARSVARPNRSGKLLEPSFAEQLAGRREASLMCLFASVLAHSRMLR